VAFVSKNSNDFDANTLRRQAQAQDVTDVKFIMTIPADNSRYRDEFKSEITRGVAVDGWPIMLMMRTEKLSLSRHS
jgi:hypothetical protein